MKPVLTQPEIRRDAVRVLRAVAKEPKLLREAAGFLPGFNRPALVIWASAEGWPDWINPASKVGQVAAVKVLAGEAARRDILVNAACPGLVDTDASRPWFDDMSGALSPDEAAADVLWLATLRIGVREPYGELVQHRNVLPFAPTA